MVVIGKFSPALPSLLETTTENIPVIDKIKDRKNTVFPVFYLIYIPKYPQPIILFPLSVRGMFHKSEK